MRLRHRLAVLTVPAVMVVAGLVLLFLAWRFEQNAEFRQANFPAVEARAKAIDTVAKVSHDSNQSASALARIIRASEDSEAGYRQLMRSTGALLLLLAAIQVITLLPILRKPSNGTLHTDARAGAVDKQPPSARAGERGR